MKRGAPAAQWGEETTLWVANYTSDTNLVFVRDAAPEAGPVPRGEKKGGITRRTFLGVRRSPKSPRLSVRKDREA